MITVQICCSYHGWAPFKPFYAFHSGTMPKPIFAHSILVGIVDRPCQKYNWEEIAVGFLSNRLTARVKILRKNPRGVSALSVPSQQSPFPPVPTPSSAKTPIPLAPDVTPVPCQAGTIQTPLLLPSLFSSHLLPLSPTPPLGLS